MSLDEIRERWEAATPGPLKAEHVASDEDGWLYASITHDHTLRDGTVCNQHLATIDSDEDDAEFIAHAPTDVARLLAAVEAVTGLADALEVEASASENTAQNILSGQPSGGWVRVAMQHEKHAEVARNHAARLREAITAALEGNR